jgi:hypothetical protein
MKVFISKILLFSFLLFLIGVCIHYTILKPFHSSPVWGNRILEEKINLLQKDKFDLVAIGSSKIHRHFNTSIIDLSLSSKKIKSFNAGVEGTFPPETYFIADKLIDDGYLDDVKYLLLEVRAIQEEKFKNWNSLRSYYWNDYPEFLIQQQLLSDCSLPESRKLFARLGNLISFGNQLLNTGEGQYTLNALYPLPSDSVEVEATGLFNGYSPLQKNDLSDEDIIELKKIKDISEVSFRKKMDKKPNKEHLRFLTALQEKANKKGIVVLFFMAEAQKKWMYEELIPLFDALPENETIVLSNANKFPDFYNQKYKSNLTHFHHEGSVMYSNYMGNEILKKIELKSNILGK